MLLTSLTQENLLISKQIKYQRECLGRGISGMLQEAFLSNISTRNTRIIQMGFINKSPTANFQREGRGFQGETWGIKAQGKRLSLSSKQHSQHFSLVTPRRSGEFSPKANTETLCRTTHRAAQVGLRILTMRGKGYCSKYCRKNGKATVHFKIPVGCTPKLLGKTGAVTEATQIL